MSDDARKILISPGFGAGWSTWIGGGNREETEFALFYQPLIDAIESADTAAFEAALAQFKREFADKFGGHEPYCGGARDLTVETVHGQFMVEEYDGSESLRFRDDSEAWF